MCERKEEGGKRKEERGRRKGGKRKGVAGLRPRRRLASPDREGGEPPLGANSQARMREAAGFGVPSEARAPSAGW